MTAPPTLAVLFAAERERRGWSEAELARRAGVPQSAVWSILHGATTRPRWDTVLALLAALGRDLMWLHRNGIKPEE